MNFLSNVLDSIPVVGHVKGVIHYAVGDTDGGNQAMYQSTRTTAVLGVGAVGSLAGPAGAALGGIYGGMITDLAVSIVNKEPVGIYESTANIGKDINSGRNPLVSVGCTSLKIALDGVGGLGMGGVFSAPSKISEKAVLKTLENTAKQSITFVGEDVLIEKSVQITAEEMAKIAAKKVSENALKNVVGKTAVCGCATEVLLVPTHVVLNASDRTVAEERAKEERKKREEAKPCKESKNRVNDEKQNSNTTNPRSSQPPQRQPPQRQPPQRQPPQRQPPEGNKDNNKKSEEENEMDYYDIFMKLLRKLLGLIYGDSAGPFSRIFENLSVGQKKYLEKIIKRIKLLDTLEEVVELVIKMFKEYSPTHISFTNFLSLMEFVVTYIENRVNLAIVRDSAERRARKYKEKLQVRKKTIQDIINQNDTVQKCADLFTQLQTEILTETSSPNNINPDFRDIFSAVYHYYKHNEGLTVKEFYNLIRKLLKELKESPEYSQVKNSRSPINIICEMYLIEFLKKFRIIVTVRDRTIVLSTAYFDINIYSDEDGTVKITITKP